MKRIFILSLVLLMALNLVACGGASNEVVDVEDDGLSKELEGQETVEYADEIVFGTPSDQDVMDGQQNVTNDKVLIGVYSSLIRFGRDNKPVGDLAKDWDVSEDGLTWTFYIHEG